ncbi:hypothetical protein QJ856_gp1248 [Tupanvirus deep ocean]|uniref:Uncharacterized protein n=2 Tax=Tupanvirus TaxID=2094720 RepID=A0AC62A6Y6_9VIRU|nr:hypothetical protein QJ856_gp1248 [Tupanvirus deep ocean]QKU33517.1 hypothetical protein [Tupanvirus deep ocean]
MTQIIGSTDNEVSVKITREITPSTLTTRIQPNKNKFLFIDSVNTFDEFTNKYGLLDYDNILTIGWHFVADHYKGIGISDDIFEERFALVNFMGKEVNSWWHYECDITDFVEFVNNVTTSNSDDTVRDESSSDSSSESEFEEEIQQPNVRYFKIVDPSTGKSFGRFTGCTPKQAASKGFTKMLQTSIRTGKETPDKTKIYLRELTRGRDRNEIYAYEASRIKLDQPQNLVIHDSVTGDKKTITYCYRNVIKKIQVPKSITNEQD